MPSRRFECKTNGHSKFWTISWPEPRANNTSYIIEWGRIDCASVSVMTKNLGIYDYRKLIESKLSKGYVESGSIVSENPLNNIKPKAKTGKKAKEFVKRANQMLGRNLSLI